MRIIKLKPVTLVRCQIGNQKNCHLSYSLLLITSIKLRQINIFLLSNKECETKEIILIDRSG